MRSFLTSLVLALGVAGGSPALAARAPQPATVKVTSTEAPSVVVGKLYSTWIHGDDSRTIPLSRVAPYLSMTYYGGLARADREGNIDVDPFCDVQCSVFSPVVAAPKYGKGHATCEVPVSLKVGLSAKSTSLKPITARMKQEHGRWVIDRIL